VTDRELVSNVVELADGWLEAISNNPEWGSPPVPFEKKHAVNGTIAYFMERLRSEDAAIWASWILNRPDVFVRAARPEEILEFLEEWSNPQITIDPIGVEVWQSRFARD
jgi:hypothetical protein